MKNNILEAVGSTPLVRLDRFLPEKQFELFVKVEALNPGGSIKDRPALAILEDARRTGAVGPDTVVIESSSGNMGVGLAQACRYYGHRFVCVVDAKTTAPNIRILRAYGAEIDVVKEPDPETGELLPARFKRVRALMEKYEDAFWPNQYANLNNPGAHYRTTMAEVAMELGGEVDFLFTATSTCGTIRGCAEFVRENGLKTRIIAVDAFGSLIFSDRQAPRNIPGLGAGLKPPLCDTSLIDEVVYVDDVDCIRGCRHLVEREAILAGGSSGGVVTAVAKLAERIPAGAKCAAVLADRGERYLDTIYDDDWVREHYGTAPLTWESASLTSKTSQLVGA